MSSKEPKKKKVQRNQRQSQKKKKKKKQGSMSDKEPIKGKIIIIIIIMQQRKKNVLTLNLRVEGVEMSFLLNHILFSFSLLFGGLKNGESWKKIGESHLFLSS